MYCMYIPTCMYVCMYMYVCVCMYACLSVCLNERTMYLTPSYVTTIFHELLNDGLQFFVNSRSEINYDAIKSCYYF